MELRCKNCHAHLSVPSVGPLKEVQCPKCGVTMLLPRPQRAPVEDDEDDAKLHKKHSDAMRRVFDPIPRPLMYGVGIVLGLILFSPFWVYLVSERLENKPVFLADDAQSIPVPTNTALRAGTAMLSTNRMDATDLAQFAGIRLEERRDELDNRFNLALQNTRGMQPEIYVARPADEIEQITAHLYDGILKEFTLLLRERLAAPAAVQKQLVEQFGQPAEQREAGNDDSTTGLGNLGLGGDAVAKRLAAFPRRRTLVWVDAINRVDATIYYSNGESPQPVSVLQIRLAAAAWLKASRPMVGSNVPVPMPVPMPTNTPERLVNPIPPLERKLAP